MARVYADLCEKGVRNFNTVPKSLKPQVRTYIEEDGYVINPDGTVTPAVVDEEEVVEETTEE
jgi:hypothetical protein